jgi:hypothetical protein
MRRLIVAVGACGIAVGVAGASGDPAGSAPTAAAAPTPTNSPIQTLVEQLGSEQFSDREAAMTALAKLGAPAIPALQAGLRNESPEVRERAAILLVKIRRVAESAERLVAKRVKLDYQAMPLGTAINDLKTRTGLNLALDPARVDNPLRRVTCQTDELPVWEALEAFCVAAGLRETFLNELDVPKSNTARRGGYTPPPPTPLADAVAVTLIDGKPEKLPGSRSSAVRVLALPPTFPGHKVTLGTGEVSLCLDVTPIPGLGWQEVAGVKITRLIDSNGRSGGAGTEKNTQPGYDPSGMVVFGRGGGMAAAAMRFDINGNPIPPDSLTNSRVVPVPLKLGSTAPRSIKRLEGSVFAELQVPNQHLIVVTDPKQKTGGWISGPGELRFSVTEVKEAAGPGGLGSVKVQLEYPSPWAVNMRKRGFNPGWPEAPRMTQGNRVEAFDADGKPFALTSNGYSDMSDDGMTTVQTLTLTFRHGLGVPAKLVVVGPKPVTVEVPFVLENVPLP